MISTEDEESYSKLGKEPPERLDGTVPGVYMEPKTVFVPASQTKKTHNLWDTG